MKIFNKEEVKLNQNMILHNIFKGAIFLYPTDTIYGIGCDARHDECVMKVRKIKGRNNMPFSVIAPDKEWIYKNCHVPEEAKKWIEEKLPGPYTIVLKLKNKDAVSKHVNAGLDTIGIRIPDHWCSEAVSIAKIPLITTSANVTGEDFMKSIDDLNPKIKSHMSFLIYEGELNSRPSKIVDFSKNNIEIKER